VQKYIQALNKRVLNRLLTVLLAVSSVCPLLYAIAPVPKKTQAKKAQAAKKQAVAAAKPKPVPVVRAKPSLPTDGDLTDGEDAVVRQAAVDALGKRSGTIVVTDAMTGRILTLVNQKMALKNGFQPCSTIKIPVALAALSESVIERETQIQLTKRSRTTMAMTQALAVSNNDYFARLGEKLGFARVSWYAKMFGLGEKATLDLDAEQPGVLPAEPPKYGGVGMMSSFGSDIKLTPLEFAGLMGAVANGGTLLYLQYPKSQQEAEAVVPRVKRDLNIEAQISSLRPGMMGAVEYGTAKRAGFDPYEPIFGKTGTCTDPATYAHLGWFGSFSQMGDRKLVVVVLLAGSKSFSGPVASGVGGQVYKSLESQNYFANAPSVSTSIAAFAGQDDR
jgi:cell division protein FtsI/penicillin-binding protein 2